MQGSEQQRRQDLYQFDSMTTDELRELLRNDALKKEADASLDIDATLYIAGVIASREHTPVTDAAWKEFERSYLPNAGKKTLYEEILSDPVDGQCLFCQAKSRTPLAAALSYRCSRNTSDIRYGFYRG